MQNLSAEWREERLAELDFTVDLFHEAFDAASAEARRCTDFDAPAMRGTTFWSRTNRFIGEKKEKEKTGWEYTTRDSILRTIHPSRSHAVTAVSAAGGVGDLDAKVRSRNPKGPKMARIVELNGQFAFMTRDAIKYGRELDDIPTWCLLYKWEKDRLLAELSMPIKMNGKFVDEWLERIPLDLPDLGAIGVDVNLLDDPGDDGGTEVIVELLGG
ncbi:hypothetical protein ACIQOW_36740 [Kitasatospora sp. NPDC091335]|uniref:hypothetical protein n=1 Tax=Kitasatospora sp. NPDC091335 TaxID=3364085 RepID=UPI00380912B1